MATRRCISPGCIVPALTGRLYCGYHSVNRGTRAGVKKAAKKAAKRAVKNAPAKKGPTKKAAVKRRSGKKGR